MFHPLSIFLGLRYSRSKKSAGFLSFISFFSMSGILLGVLSLIVVVSVMNGFEKQLKDRILGAVPHLIINQHDEQNTPPAELITTLEQLPSVSSILPYQESESIVQSPYELKGVMTQGVFDKTKGFEIIKTNMVNGSWESLFSQKYSIVIGRYLASQLKVRIGDKVKLMVTEASIYTPLGRMPSQRNFTVTGIFDTESEIDDKIVLISGDALQKLLRKKNKTAEHWRVYLHDAFEFSEVTSQLDNAGIIYSSWEGTHGKLFQAVKMEKNIMWILLTLVIAVASFNIVSALVMMVTEKTSEIAILKTQGIKNITLYKTFVIQGLYNGVIGSILGVILGVLITLNINEISAVFGLSMLGPNIELPILLQLSDVLIIFVGALGLSLLATVYPAYQAAKIEPASVLRYE
ncbi:lipoprotein-releasing ABC transporter permease subunit [Flocculibacter collagenilyticus]|uniref:lipoprotein-releasing ABC transporter permease subunit n=1 Tax=Flocculibacter collagenilyticus TaxID=2744479 RepID=UPI0018F382AB|nr:lipoprotein-releasing ABC transporter permease subunit [Flocculibacter collagenilyticus]